MYDWVCCYKREKLQKRKDGACINRDNVDSIQVNDVFDDEVADVSQDLSDISLNNSDGEDIVNLNERPTCKPGGIMSFGKGHPLHDSHGVRHISKNSMHVPNFAALIYQGATKGTENITLARCLLYSSRGERALT